MAKQRGSAADPLWYKDALIYELHVRAFKDSNGDGIGDFPGLIQKLDYLQDLGVTCLWLLPFFPSPLKDDGYDISDYLGVHPMYGTIEDFQAFLKAAHERSLQVMIELVLNHTSDQHPWFQAARNAPPGSPERDFYVWSDTDQKYPEARIIFTDTEKSNWAWDPVAKAYYWHRFFSHQPDLNFDDRPAYDRLAGVIQRALYCARSAACFITHWGKMFLALETGDSIAMKAQATPSDEDLIEGARAGNANDFGELVRRHSRQVYGMSFRVLKNREDAEDNLQNAFCKAYGKMRQFEGKSQFSTWLMRIAINEALMMLRKRRSEGLAPYSNADDETGDREPDIRDLRADPEREYLTKELAARAFAALRPSLKYTFILQKAEGWTSEELAEAMDVTKETVKSRIFRARLRMRERLAAISKESVALHG